MSRGYLKFSMWKHEDRCAVLCCAVQNPVVTQRATRATKWILGWGRSCGDVETTTHEARGRLAV